MEAIQKACMDSGVLNKRFVKVSKFYKQWVSLIDWLSDKLFLGSNRKSYIIQSELRYSSTMVSCCYIFQPMSLFQDYVLIMPSSCRLSYFSSYWPLFSRTSLPPEQASSVSFVSEFFKISPSGKTHVTFSLSPQLIIFPFYFVSAEDHHHL